MLVLQRPLEHGEPGQLEPLGKRADVLEAFARFNTAPERLDGELTGSVHLLHGPGMVIEISPEGDRVMQAIIHLKERDIAWAVLWRLCQRTGWKMMDPETGQQFG